MAILKQNEAVTRMFFLGGTGLGPSCTISKNGGSFASSANTPAEIAHGWYSLAVVGGETDTVGDLAFHFNAGTYTDFIDQVAPEVQADVAKWRGETPEGLDTGRVGVKVREMAANVLTASAIASAALTAAKFATDAIDANALKADAVAEIAAAIWDLATSGHTSAGTFGAQAKTVIDAINAKTTNLPASPAAVSNIPTANQNADAVLDRADGIETNYPLRKRLRLILSGLAAKLAGAGSGTVSIRDVNDTKDRIVATTDELGNRTAVTLDAS